MKIFWSEKIVAAEDQSSKLCFACGRKMSLVKLIVDSDTGDVIHMFECMCGERVWDD
jgi:hypothetical protein